ncbi:MAG: efflux RND transporter periplasmic adaptor subunit [Ignavibacteria bacterium]|nr:efflux RND transporter periplasmic adaptor subunit [Ignavibacteria bacterium]MBT8383316.1 efflux RND transporter periplasmic adaptor subunit [Ignavibacteria bacterium]MBT8391388.1 efflux RND transporter periplasmic adaptor subunit [Ignavibacteria bacterium]NNL22553.1 HlyD family efflux transporter periplasmic adaptor subunit [Ignavibacteriaceae bacterium]
MKFKKSTMIKAGSVVGIVILGFLIMSVLGSTEKHSNKREVEPEVRLVETQSVNFGDLVLEIEGNGVVESQRSLNMVSEATGPVMFAKNDLKDGTYVRKGELILEVDSREVENNLFTYRSEFMNALALVLPEIKIENESAYKKWYKYFNSLDIHEAVPDFPKINDSQEKIKLSGRGIFSKYYAVKNQEILLSKYRITAPFSGYIKSNGIIKGSFVAKGQQLFTLSDAINVEIAVPLLIEEVNLINFSIPPATKIFPNKYQNEVFYGKIYRKETLLNRNSQTLNVYVSFTNRKLNSHFLPGNYVTLKIEGAQLTDVAKIPRYVVDNENHVFTMEDGKLARRKVEVLALQGNYAIIKKASELDMKIVTTILQKPLIGMNIKSNNESIELKEELPEEDKSKQLSQTD